MVYVLNRCTRCFGGCHTHAFLFFYWWFMLYQLFFPGIVLGVAFCIQGAGTAAGAVQESCFDAAFQREGLSWDGTCIGSGEKCDGMGYKMDGGGQCECQGNVELFVVFVNIVAGTIL